LLTFLAKPPELPSTRQDWRTTSTLY